MSLAGERLVRFRTEQSSRIFFNEPYSDVHCLGSNLGASHNPLVSFERIQECVAVCGELLIT
jgi:hypothetical protein